MLFIVIVTSLKDILVAEADDQRVRTAAIIVNQRVSTAAIEQHV